MKFWEALVMVLERVEAEMAPEMDDLEKRELAIALSFVRTHKDSAQIIASHIVAAILALRPDILGHITGLASVNAVLLKRAA